IVSEPITLIAVTKGRSLSEIQEAITAGITHVGENRLQEAKEKLPHLPKNITKHFIGRLQSNKIREVVALFDVIQSVDSLKLAQKINDECQKIDKVMPILIQVNISGERQKGGLPPNEVANLIETASVLPNIRIEGLMAIGERTDDEKVAINGFRKLKNLCDELQKKPRNWIQVSYRSIGMSENFLLAIQEGSNMVRIGRGIFE
ncbi:YggS family pyridoxal phosphate-dependent enzyme, partial [Candidatus Pacearchaeota archaeon]|nr:YggS family pyridoxal phosphate-dependent enzyme [Candidatus Pacearchaeota archaeon]